MDIHTSGLSVSDVEREAVDAVVSNGSGRFACSGDKHLNGAHVSLGGSRFRSERRNLLLPVLHALQERIGWISREALEYACLQLGVAPAEAYGVATAYALFSVEPAPTTVLHVCDDIACLASQGQDPRLAAQRAIGSEGAPVGEFVWHGSPCLGHCDHGSAALVQQAGTSPQRQSLSPTNADTFTRIQLAAAESNTSMSASNGPDADATYGIPQMQTDRGNLRLLRRVGIVDPTSIDSYRAHGGYEALRRAIKIGPEFMIQELKDARLLGRGGAAFPTGVKWQAVASNPVRPHYFVCNADESEPGTFKDRILMELDPFALIEALTIAGFVTGSESGYIYIRGEYPLAECRLNEAIEQANTRGLLGPDLLGAGFDFNIEIRRGAGAYIAGEETALFNSIEGNRPEPRNKPPFPTQAGLFGKPTGANNVETLFNVLEIVRSGAGAFAPLGTAESTGTRLFCLSGAVEHPGLYEIPMGRSLRYLLELAGGVRGGRGLKAVLLGGAAGMFVTADQLDIELSFEGARSANVTLGSGVVIVFDEQADFDFIIPRIARFFSDESCGQCVPCRVGTARQEELVTRLAANTPLGSLRQELDLLTDVGTVMRDASICGLGQTASSAIESAIRLGLFPSQPAEQRSQAL